MITLHLTRADDYEGVYLPLPATPAEIGEAWAALDGISDDTASTRIVGAVSNVWGIGQYLENANVNGSGQFEKLNRIAELTLGLDRDSGIVSHLFDERDPAVKALLSMAIHACRKAGKYIGICGQGPSDHPDLAFWLMEQGIESVSLNPDSVLDTWFFLSEEKAQQA